MGPAIGAALISAIGSLASSGLNYAAQSSINRKNYRLNEKLAEQAFRRNMQSWSAENFYNSPAAQMARYAAAGINPNVLYGESQQVASGNSDSVPELSYPAYQVKAPVFDYESPMQQLLSAAQISNLNAKTKTEDQERPVRIAKMMKDIEYEDNLITQVQTAVEGMRLDNYIKDKTKENLIKLRELDVTSAEADIEIKKVEKELGEAKTAEAYKKLDVYDQQIENMKELKLKIHRERTTLMDAVIRNYDAKTAESYGHVSLMQHQENLVDKNVELLTKQIEKYVEQVDALIKNIEARTDLTNTQKDLLGKKVRSFFFDEYIMGYFKILSMQAGAAANVVSSLGS